VKATCRMRPNEQPKRDLLDCRAGQGEPTRVVVMVVRLAGSYPRKSHTL